jgi:hypothetical protein
MPRAILKDGAVHLLEPLPAEWAEGKELIVEAAVEDGADPDEKWFDALEASVQRINPKDIEKLEAALREADEQAKAMMRREMGLP